MISRKKLRAFLTYDQNTGVFTRRKSGWSKLVGQPAGVKDSYGYLQIRIDGKLYLAHRLAWLYVHGSWPTKGLDHVNGVRDDNRIANLREATQAENMQNQFSAHSTNKSSGLLGAHWDPKGPKGKKWRATIRVNGKNKVAGHFATAKEAHAAYLAAKRKHHPFGELAKQ